MKMYYLDGKNKHNNNNLKYLKRFTANYNAPSGKKQKKQWLNQLEIQLERFR